MPTSAGPAKPKARSETSRSGLPKFAVLAAKVIDTPLKTQVEEHLLIQGNVTKDSVETLLIDRHEKAMARRDFEHHDRATNVFVYIYETAEHHESGQGLWLGMLAMSPSDRGKPVITIMEDAIRRVGAKPTSRLGLSEPERRELFRRIVEAEDRATREALAGQPDDLHRQIDLENTLADRYKDALAEQHGFTRDELMSISIEGLKKRWPMPRFR